MTVNKYCPIARTTALVGDAWTPLLLRELLAGRSRFAELQEALDISKAVLTQRLRKLEADEIVARVAYQDRPPRHEYVLTDKGRALWDVLFAMWSFGDEWLFRDGAGVELVHATSGERIVPRVVDEESGQRIELADTRIRRRQR